MQLPGDTGLKTMTTSTTIDRAIEAEIQTKGLTAPRVTPADVEAAIASEFYFTGEDGVNGSLDAERARGSFIDAIVPPALGSLMVCVLVLKNGHLVTGEALLQDLSKPDPERARASARRRAFDKAYDMVVYAERERLAARNITTADAMAALKDAIKKDPEYAWSWHCAIWSGAHDEGLETGAANRAAARVMHMAFDCDTSKNANFSAALPIPAPDLRPTPDGQPE